MSHAENYILFYEKAINESRPEQIKPAWLNH